MADVGIRLTLQGANEVNSGLTKVNQGLDGLGGAAKGALSNVVALGGALGAAFSVGAIIKAADAVTVLNNQLKLVTSSTTAAAQAYGALFDIAQRSRVSFAELGQTYASIARAGEQLGISQSRLLGVTEAISNAVTVSGGSAESAKAALIQLSQGLASGTLRGDELNSVMEQTPRLAKALADGLGITTGELRKMGAEGEISAAKVIKALESQSNVLKNEVATSVVTVGQAFTQLTNSATNTIGEFDKATGTSASLAKAMQGLSGAIDSVGKSFKENEQTINTVMGVIGGTATAAGIGLVVTRIGAIGAALGGITGTVGALSALLLANPATAILLGIGAVAGGSVAYLQSQAKSVDGIRNSIEQLNQENERSTVALARAQAAGRTSGVDTIAKTIADRTARIKEFNAELTKLQQGGFIGIGGSGDRLLEQADKREYANRLKLKKAFDSDYASQDQKAIAEIKKQRELLGDLFTPADEAKIRAKFKNPAGAKIAAEATEAAKAYEQAIEKYTAAGQRAQANIDGLTVSQAHLVEQLLDPVFQSMPEAWKQTVLQVAYANIAIEQNEIALKELTKAREAEAKVFESGADNAAKAAQKAEDELESFGKTKEALSELTIARLRDQQAEQLSFGKAGNAAALQRQIEDIKRLAKAQDGLISKQALKKSADDAESEWKKAADKIEESITDALLRGFESGKGFAENLRDTVVNMFKTMILRPVVEMGVRGGLGLLGLGGASGLAGAAETVGGIGNALNGASLISGMSGWLTNFGTSATQALYKAGEAAYSLGFEKIGGSIMDGVSSAGNFSAIADGLDTVGNGLGYLSAAMALMDGKIGQAAGSAIGTYFGGPIGAAIGGAIGGWVDNAFGGGHEYTTGGGISGRVGGSQGFSGQRYQDWRNDGSSGFFGIGGSGSSSGTNYSALDQSTQTGLGRVFLAMQVQTATFAAALGQSTDQIANYSQDIRVALGGDEAANKAAINAAFAQVGENLVSAAFGGALKALAKEGEGGSATLARLATGIIATNAWLSMLRQRLFQVGLAGADAASKLADTFGGLDKLGAATQVYYGLYFTSAEKAADSTAAMTSALAVFNLALPSSKEGFRALADSLDLNTDAGRAAYATLIKIAPEFAASADAAAAAAKNMAAQLLSTFTANGALAPALNLAYTSLTDIAGAATVFSGTVHTINTVMGDASSGVLTFSDTVAALDSASLSPAQAAVGALAQSISDLKSSANIDFAGLSTALANVNTETFMAVLDGVFANLGARFKSLQDSITGERVAVREAATQIIDPKTYNRAQIAAGVAGSAVGLPSREGLDLAGANLAAALAASAVVRAAQAVQATAQGNLSSAQTARQLGINQFSGKAAQFKSTADQYGVTANNSAGGQAYAYNAATNRVADYAYISYSNSITEYKNLFGQVIKRESSGSDVQGFKNAVNAPGGLVDILEGANAALAGFDASVASAQTALTGATQGVANTNPSAVAAAQIKAESEAKLATIAYANSVQKYAVDAANATAKLSKLREETVKYYEQQKALAELMTNSAGALRKTVADYRYSQLGPEQQFAQLQGQFSTAYSLALSTSDATKAGYADKLNALLPSLLELANQTGRSGLIESYLAQSDAVAKALEDSAPKNYQNESLALLDSIDLTLEALGSGTQLLLGAINAGKDSTVGGLRAVVAAITGQAIPAFATGGYHSGGLRLVGENGPELEVTGASTIYSAAQTRGMFGGGGRDDGLMQELRALRAEVAGLREEARATAAYTNKTAKILERVTPDGNSLQTVAA